MVDLKDTGLVEQGIMDKRPMKTVIDENDFLDKLNGMSKKLLIHLFCTLKVYCQLTHVCFSKTENDINRSQNIDSPIAIASDGFDKVFVGTDKRILMISPDAKVNKQR